ncbi:unnamed protein product [Polarella glacialis]|uniref:CCHC-type domain-containing protein n=1 Tax=Polarella glacialis TaxID=89957 RepID=A0A813FGM1_POLGL|nr:unnamed protein product [Polarella glacialis]
MSVACAEKTSGSPVDAPISAADSASLKLDWQRQAKESSTEQGPPKKKARHGEPPGGKPKPRPEGPQTLVVLGLGNPGGAEKRERHSLGARVVEALASAREGPDIEAVNSEGCKDVEGARWLRWGKATCFSHSVSDNGVWFHTALSAASGRYIIGDHMSRVLFASQPSGGSTEAVGSETRAVKTGYSCCFLNGRSMTTGLGLVHKSLKLGVGKLRHLADQEVLRAKQVELAKIDCELKVANILTKHLQPARLEQPEGPRQVPDLRPASVTRALGRTLGEPTVGAVLASLADAGLADKEEAPLAALEAGSVERYVADVVMMDAAASTPVTRQAQETEMTRAFREVAGRMVDMRGVAKPPNFTGLETDWAEWKFRMEAILSLLGLDDLAEAAVREGVDADARLLSDADELRSKMLYNLLVQLCSGKALSLVRTVRRADGLGSWAKLVREYEPSVAARHCAMLSSLLCPGFEDSKPFTEQLLEWERRITDYELVTKAMFPDAYKCAVISRWAPKRVREFLRVNTSDLTASYVELKRALRDLQVRSQTFDAAGQGSQDQHSEYVPMIVDALKGLGKWKTATKADECRNCGKKGRFARDCRSQPKGKAKGKSKGTDRKGGGKAGQGQWPQWPRDQGQWPRDQGQQKQPEHQGAQGKGKGQAFDGKCFQCGKEGHRARDCRQKPIAELAEPEPHPLDGQDSQSWFMMLAETASKIRDIPKEEQGLTLMLVDSGSCAHVCPKDFAPSQKFVPQEWDKLPQAAAVDGHPVRAYGWKPVHMQLEDGRPLFVNFLAMDVTRPILSVAELVKSGYEMWFGSLEHPQPFIRKGGVKMRLIRHANLFFLPVRQQEQWKTTEPLGQQQRRRQRQQGQPLGECRWGPELATCTADQRDFWDESSDDDVPRSFKSAWEAKRAAEAAGQDGAKKFARQAMWNCQHSDKRQAKSWRSGFIGALPSADERKAHEVTHLPYQQWCPVCVSCKAADSPHHRLPEEGADDTPVVEFDYGFVSPTGQADECEAPVVLVARAKQSGYSFATVVKVKGAGDTAAVQGVLGFLQEAGLPGQRLRLRSDQEGSIRACVSRIAAQRAAETIVETTPKGSSNSLGAAERFIRTLMTQVATLCTQVQQQWNVELKADSPLLPWVVGHAVWLLNRFQPYLGETPFHRVQGHEYRGEVYAFGQPLLVRKVESQSRLQPRWDAGIFLGKLTSSDEFVVAAEAGIRRGRSVKEAPGAMTDYLARLRWTQDSRDEGREVQPAAPRPMRFREGGGAHTARGMALRQFHAEAGPTPGCAACDNPMGRTHSKRCVVRRGEYEAKRQRTDEGPDGQALPAATTAPDVEMPGTGVKRGREQEPDEDMSGGDMSGGDMAGDDVQVSLISITGPPWYDGRDGHELDSKAVDEGMARETASLKKFGVYTEVDENACPAKELVSTRWVLNEKSAGMVKARLVAQQLNKGEPCDAFAATPALSSLRLILCLGLPRGYTAFLGDVSTAFLHAGIQEPMFVRPPPSLRRPGKVWWLHKALYGLRRSPQLWQEHWAEVAKQCGFRRSLADPQVFVHEQSGAMLLAHVDDMLVVAPPEWMGTIKKAIGEKVTMKWLDELSHDKWSKFLGKELKLSPGGGVLVRVPPSYFEDVLKEMGLQDCKSLTSLGSVTADMRTSGKERLNAGRHTQYRRCVGRLLWAINERPDLAFCVKELARDVASPTTASWANLKKLCRYLRGTTTAVLELGGTKAAEARGALPATVNEGLVVFTDSNWAARSTSGGVALCNGWLISTWSRTQTTVALSSCEAEFVAISQGLVEGKAVQSLAKELGTEMPLTICTDSSSARALSMRRGFGRLKHLEVRNLWVQQEFKEKSFELVKVPTALNLSDLLTKAVNPKVLWCPSELLGLQLEGEEAAEAAEVVVHLLELNALEQYQPPACGQCHAPALLEVTHGGQVYWRCQRCRRTQTWHAYMRGWTAWAADGATRPEADEPGRADDQRPVPPATRRARETTTRRTATTTTNVIVNATTDGRQGRAPLGPAVGGANAVGSEQRQSQPTQRQLDWIATLALQRGFVVADVLSAASTKAEASALIDQLRAPPH